MSSVLGVLPLVAFGLGFLLLGNVRPEWGWSRAFLRAAVVCGAYAVVVAEGLSLFHGLTSAAAVALWVLPSLLLGYLLLRRVRRPGWRFPRLPRLPAPEAVMAGVLGRSPPPRAHLFLPAPPPNPGLLVS